MDAAQVALTISCVNTVLILGVYYVLYRKGALGRDDVLLILKVVASFVPYINNPILKNVINEVIHALMERMRLLEKYEDIDAIIKRIEELASLPVAQSPATK